MKNRNCFIALAFVFLATCIFNTRAIAQQSLLTSHSSQEQLELIDGGQLRPFADPKTKAMVFVFVSTDCPIANAYHPLLAEMQNQFQPEGVQFVLVHSSQTTTAEQAKKHVSDYKIQLPVVLDSQQQLAKQLSAKVTPEAFLLVKGQTEPAYRGRIDNLYEGYGKKRSTVTKHFLRDAIQAVLDGQPVPVTETKPVGCFIEYSTTELAPKNPSDESLTQATDDAELQKAAKDDEADYDPSQEKFKYKISDKDITDSQRNRTLPIRLYVPIDAPQPYPVIVLSHGLGGNRQACSYMGKHWSSRGYFVIALQHPGSDESVWKIQPRRQIMSKLKTAANGKNLQLRVDDVHFAIDQLEQWNDDQQHEWFERLNLKKIGMSGHSFGAVTTQAIAGQKYGGQTMFVDSRVIAALTLSPSPARFGDVDSAFGHIQMPWLSITGTLDEAPIGGIKAEDRPKVFQALPNDDKFELVLNEATHYALDDSQMRGRNEKRNPSHHKAIEAVSTAFWDSYLGKNKQAIQWLNSDDVKAILDDKDQWRKK